MAQNIQDLLTPDEYAFVMAVFLSPGSKIDNCFSAQADEEGSFALWTKPERLGLIKCVGAYKWVPENMEMKLFTTQ